MPQPGGRLIFTGDVKLGLSNAFRQGETLDLNWRTPQPLTQDLKSRIVYPFLFKTPFGIDFYFSLFKKDTTFIDLNFHPSLQYRLGNGSFLKIFIQKRQTFMLLTKSLSNLSALPSFGDLASTLYGLGIKSEKTDYRFNPTKGHVFHANAAVGNKKILKNRFLDEKLYENMNLNPVHFQLDYSGELFITLYKRNILNLGIKGGHMKSDRLFRNELPRIGGIRTLRGFDEESMPASSYHILKTEYRFIAEKNTYFFAFFNIAYYENISQGSRYFDRPLGFGAGMTFETRTGIFSLAYALGREADNPVFLRNGKIHFGITNTF
jgi:hypothetical protein